MHGTESAPESDQLHTLGSNVYKTNINHLVQKLVIIRPSQAKIII